MRIRNIYIILFFLLFTCLSYGNLDAIFKLGVSSRADAMGQAFVGMNEDISIYFYNPAGLYRLKLQGVLFNYIDLFDENAVFNSAGMVYPLKKKGTLSLSLMGITVKEIEGRDIEGAFTKKFSYEKYLYMAGYGWEIFNNITAGGNITVIQENFYSEAATGMGFNAGLQYHPYSQLLKQIEKERADIREFLNNVNQENIKDLYDQQLDIESKKDLLESILIIDPENKKLHKYLKNIKDQDAIDKFADVIITVCKKNEAEEKIYICPKILKDLDNFYKNNKVQTYISHLETALKKRDAELKSEIENYLAANRFEDIILLSVDGILLETDNKYYISKIEFVKKIWNNKTYIKDKAEHYFQAGKRLKNEQDFTGVDENFMLCELLLDNPYINKFTYGLAIDNLAKPSLQLGSEKEVFPQVYRTGASYRFENLPLCLCAELDYIGDHNELIYKAGVEYRLLNDMLMFRAGYEDGMPGAGFGISFYNVSVDYSIKDTDLDILHKFSVSYLFGKNIPRTAIDFFNQGEFLYKNSNYLEAIKEWERALEINPNFNLAKERIIQTNKILDEKIVLLKKEFTDNLKANDIVSARENLNAVLKIDLNDEFANKTLLVINAKIKSKVNNLLVEAKEFKAQEKYIDAINSYNDVLELDSGNPIARNEIKELNKYKIQVISHLKNEALTFLQDGNLNAAMQKYKEILKIDPGDKNIQSQLEKVIKKIEQSDKIKTAIAEIEELIRQEQYDTAKSHLEKMILEIPDSLELKKLAIKVIREKEKKMADYKVKGNLFDKNKDYKNAVYYYKKYLKLNPADSEIKARYNKLKDLAKVIDVVGSSLKKYYDYKTKGKYIEARNIIKEALKSNPGNSELLTQKNEINGLIDSEITELKNRIKTERNSNQIEKIYSRLFYLTGQHIYADKLVEHYINLGLKLYREEKLESAIVAWKKALKYDPNNAKVKDNIKRTEEELRKLKGIE